MNQRELIHEEMLRIWTLEILQEFLKLKNLLYM